MQSFFFSTIYIIKTKVGILGFSLRYLNKLFFVCRRLIVEYNGAPSAYTHTISVKAIEPTKVKYATVMVAYPSAPPHKNTIIKGMIKALNRTVGNPIRIKR